MRRYLKWTVPAAVAGAVAVAVSGVAAPSGSAPFGSVSAGNVKAAGYSPASELGDGLTQIPVAAGAMKLENPSGAVTNYGYENDTSSPDNPAVPEMVPANLSSPAEAQKTEPDKNTYLVFAAGQETGPDSAYDYGRHFLFQGHEAGAGNPKQGLLTRVNLDADTDHRVTLMATQDTDGNPIATIDGSTWDPWAQRLLLTTENESAPTYAATASFPSTVENVSGALGRGGYEGIQNDSDGNIWIVEDIGGPGKNGTTAKQPNSYVYRYVPAAPGDLHNGKLEVLQVVKANGKPITWDSEAALNAPDQVALHTYGRTFDTKWVTIHDTATDGTASFDANPLAKAAGATPFKRPENGQFRPNAGFTEFYFAETGDTNSTSPENGDPSTGAGGAGGWGAIMKLTQSGPSAATGKLTMFYRCKENDASLDNVAFLSHNLVTFVEDAGDGLHSQRDALDSGYIWNTALSYASGANQPTRWLAEGRDPSATLDSANGGFGKNEGDNEITGVHVSDGNRTTAGILGARDPQPFSNGWRWFYTQQHGDNYTYEVIRTP